MQSQTVESLQQALHDIQEGKCSVCCGDIISGGVPRGD